MATGIMAALYFCLWSLLFKLTMIAHKCKPVSCGVQGFGTIGRISLCVTLICFLHLNGAAPISALILQKRDANSKLSIINLLEQEVGEGWKGRTRGVDLVNL